MATRATRCPTPLHLSFSTAGLSPSLDDGARRHAWRETCSQLYGPLEFDFADGPFSAELDFKRFGAVGIAACRGSIERMVRTRHCVAVAGSDNLQLAVNASSTPMRARQMNREATLAPGGMTLVSDAAAGEFAQGAGNHWLFVLLPRAPLLNNVRNAEDMFARSLDGTRPTARYLRRYLGMLAASEELAGAPHLEEHVATTLLDLVSLLLKPNADAAVMVNQRGLRDFRLRAVLDAIRRRYAQPDLSVGQVAATVGVSSRYVQDLLHETGTSFTATLLEFRLQRAHEMLGDPRYRELKVLDIALASGFSDISYFNRAFRRQFDAAPSEVRACPDQQMFRNSGK